ncbi:DUF1648 domain-containing protein [Phocaeicola sp.]
MRYLLKFIKKENIAPVMLADRILEVAALVLALFLVVVTVFFYMNAPEQIPTHFNGRGEIDGWSEKNTYFVLLAAFLVGMAICNMAAYNHKLVNLPVNLNPKCMPQQLALIGRMVRILSILIGVLGLILLLMSSASQLGCESSKLNPFFILVLCAVAIDIIFYTIRIWYVGKQY